mgnify:CR=1 FL=1
MLSTLLGRQRRFCGVNDLKCGTCKRCQKEEEERWNQIWKQKYGDQEARYYSRPALDRLEEYSRKQSSLVTNWPIVEEAFSLDGTERAEKSKLRAAGRRVKVARAKLSRLSPALQD